MAEAGSRLIAAHAPQTGLNRLFAMQALAPGRSRPHRVPIMDAPGSAEAVAGDCGCGDSCGGHCSPCGDGSPPPPVHLMIVADGHAPLFTWRATSPLLARTIVNRGADSRLIGECAMDADVCIDDDACTPNT